MLGGLANIGSVPGSPDFVKNALGALASAGGGARTSLSVGGSNTLNASINPTFVQSTGGPVGVSPTIGGATATPSTSASSSAAGQDPSSLYNRNLPAYRTTPVGDPFYDPLNTLGGGVGGDGDLMLPILIGGALLLFVLNE
jgi:hypothetical protein